MGDPRTGMVEWYDPDPRAILPLEDFHVPQTLLRLCKRSPFEIVTDSAFEAVIDACANRALTWITPPIRKVYVALHKRGHAHSIEAWRGGKLVGGLYGVQLGGAFMGESMFHHATDASKVCLVALVALLRRLGFALLDTQFMTDHLAKFGAIDIPRASYLRRLAVAVELSPRWP